MRETNEEQCDHTHLLAAIGAQTALLGAVLDVLGATRSLSAGDLDAILDAARTVMRNCPDENIRFEGLSIIDSFAKGRRRPVVQN
jgi:hypothetical protein